MAVVAASVVYLPALRNGFLWDDPFVLQQLRAIRSWTDLVVLPAVVPKFYYRPIVFVSYLFDRSLGGEAPFWFHFSVVALHVANTALVFLLAQRLWNDALVAGLAALLFAVYPTHVESVAWMAGRSDVIVATFILVAMLLFSKRDAAWSAWLGGAAYLLGLLSKEMALAVVLLVPLADWLVVERLLYWRYVPLIAATVLYFLLRQSSLGTPVGGMATAQSLSQQGLDLIRALGFYARQSVFPFQLSGYVPQIPEGAVFVIAGVALLVAGAIAFVYARQRRQSGIALLVAWYFLTLAPSLTVILRRSASAVVADRYLYVPSIALCMVAAWALARTGARRSVPAAALAAGAALSLVFAVKTWTYSQVWRDNLSFWSDVAAKVPGDALPQREVGIALLERGRTGEAEVALRHALDLPSDTEGRVMALSNLGNVYRRTGRTDEAIDAFESALQAGPHPALYHNLGLTLISKIEKEQRAGDQDGVRRDIVKARQAFESALTFEDKPGASAFLQQWSPAKSHSLLGQVLFSLGDVAGARQHLEAALRLEPTGPVADLTRQYMSRLK
ncbi:MAG: tetratricopeptide repeat protein [Deltaproteobacteria bacterium]|nr:tetratricopeptide repeat protein [Deltaproteobacteria bacterium]